MKEIFLSASVPVIGRGAYHETSDPFLIQCAVRELVIAVIRSHTIVWGGHPAITPMIWSICHDLNVDYAKSVVLYQSRYFEQQFPEENRHFANTIFVDAVAADRDASLLRMRQAMLSRADLVAAVFVGGMEGVEVEYDIFRTYHPHDKVLPVPAPGGAAQLLAQRLNGTDESTLHDVDFATLFLTEFADQQKRNAGTGE